MSINANYIYYIPQPFLVKGIHPLATRIVDSATHFVPLSSLEAVVAFFKR
jgi:hypothetical protein